MASGDSLMMSARYRLVSWMFLKSRWFSMAMPIWAPMPSSVADRSSPIAVPDGRVEGHDADQAVADGDGHGGRRLRALEDDDGRVAGPDGVRVLGHVVEHLPVADGLAGVGPRRDGGQLRVAHAFLLAEVDRPGVHGQQLEGIA